MNTILSPAVMLAVASAISAQTLVVVPPGFAAMDAPRRTTIVGHDAERMQLVIDATQHGLSSGQTIESIYFRRDHADGNALPGSALDLVVRLGEASQSAASALPDFQLNAARLVEGFRGRVMAPASPVPSSHDWSATNVIRIDITPPFLFQGGGLVVDIESTPSGSAVWPIDAVGEIAFGSSSAIGSPCGPFGHWPETAFADNGSLIAGKTARISLRATPSAVCMLLVSNAVLSSPIDLSGYGAIGCSLHLQPFASVSAIAAAPEFTPEFGGAAFVDLHLPLGIGLEGGSLALQWIEAGVGAFTASNALDCRIATAAPSLGMSLIHAPIGANPRVLAIGVPVIGLTVR